MTRVTLLPAELLSNDEIDALVRILNEDAELRKWLYPNEVDVHLTRDEFINIGKNWAQHNMAHIYCIFTHGPIGTISISHITNDGSARIGYWIASKEWGKGFGTSAFELILEKARQIGVRVVSAKIDCQNTASIAIWENHGASQETVGNNQIQVSLRIQEPEI